MLMTNVNFVHLSVEVLNAGSNGGVWVHNFSAVQEILPVDHPLTFDVSVVDGDGDIASSTLGVALQTLH